MGATLKQHLIDPEICIRCNTCEATCPMGAVTHDINNYVVRADTCNFCMDCVPPCPTGAVDTWFQVARTYSIEDQFSWSELPARAAEAAPDALDDEAEALLADAHRATGPARPPASASKPRVNLFSRANPALATVTGNIQVTRSGTASDVHHIILDFGATAFPVLEGQSIGIVPPGDARMRLYSISSARDGERPNTNNLALTVRRVVDVAPDGREVRGRASNHLCDLQPGDTVPVIGPFGASFLMPDDPDADIIMICTGTGAAPFRGFTERRRRLGGGRGRLYMFFGARAPHELPYFGPLRTVPPAILHQELVYSRLPDQPKEYVQHRMRARAALLADLLRRERTHIYICGLRGVEAGAEAAFAEIAAAEGLDWSTLRAALRDGGRFHVETY